MSITLISYTFGVESYQRKEERTEKKGEFLDNVTMKTKKKKGTLLYEARGKCIRKHRMTEYLQTIAESLGMRSDKLLCAIRSI